jgi:hypothetical protein
MFLLIRDVQEIQYFDVYKLGALTKAQPDTLEKWLTI